LVAISSRHPSHQVKTMDDGAEIMPPFEHKQKVKMKK
jgi:hypothetical protein